MTLASPPSSVVREPSQHVQTVDTFLLEAECYEREYRRRKQRFLTLQEREDVSNQRLFILSDNKPWQVFLNGYTKFLSGYTQLQRRKLVFERYRDFPALHQASVTGDRELVRSLLSTPGVCVLERDVCGRIALHHAVITEHLKLAKRFLRRRDAKLQVLVQDNSNRTALHYALEKMELLALHGRKTETIPALVTAEMRAESKRYRRLWKLADRMLKMISSTILNGECELEEVQGENLKVLDMKCRGDLWDVCRSGDLERLESIVEIYGCCKGDWELSDLRRTLLHEACENQQLPVVYFLISTVGLPAGSQDVAGCTALHCAARRGYLDVCQVLLGKPLFENGDQTILISEVAEELVLIQDVRGRTALHWSLLGSGDPLARLQVATLLSQSCTPALHICDNDGVYPLHLAIWRGELELVQIFIGIGANVGASSPTVHLPQHNTDVEKAPWAPCGIVFQRRRKTILQKAPTTTDFIDEAALCGVGTPTPRRRSVPDWENVRHPVEVLWYWQSGSRRSGSDEKMNKSEKHQHNDSEIAEEEFGCRKYGGICDRCKLPTEDNRVQSSATTTFQVLPPLLLALRMCRLKYGDRMLDRQVAVIDLLLMNGANPDGICDTEDIAGNSVELNINVPSSLIEGLRSSLRYPQILPKLLQHGAMRISTSDLVHWCSTTSSSRSNQVETVLNHLLELENVASSLEFLATLFGHKYFRTLQKCITHLSLKSQNFSLTDSTDETSEREQRDSSPWKGMYDQLLAWSGGRRKPEELESIEIEHLEFLHGLVHETTGDDGIWLLFEYCVDIYLRHECNIGMWQKPTGPPIEKFERIVLICLLTLFKHWKTIQADDQKIRPKMTTWLQSTITIGFFACALVLLETLHHLGPSRLLLDTVFDLHASAVGARRNGRDQFRYHREFLLVCTENLMKSTASAADQDHQRSNPIASIRSIVHMCANNFQLTFIISCFEIEFPDGLTDTTSDQLNATQVRGKTMVQWIVTHMRSDIMEWLLLSFPVGSERGLCWKKFVAALNAPVSNDDSESINTFSSFMEKVFVFYMENVQQHLSVNERDKLLVDLMVNCAIPDSVTLAKQLIDCWVSKNCTNDEIGNIKLALKEARVLRSIVRYNAIAMAEICLSGQLLNEVDWHKLFTEENQGHHEQDDCNPLELCRLLGHNQLYKALSSKLLQTSVAKFKIDEKLDKEDPGEDESVTRSDTQEEISTAHSFVGLLRSVLTINEVLGKNGTVDIFKGYKRDVSVQGQWNSAVVLDQVSHLQAMALTRGPDTSVCSLVLTAIKSGSMNALKWIVDTNTPLEKYLSAAEGTECLYAAAKHTGDVYAEMTLLLLEKHLSPGRLSGDGMGVPLLHRAACFSNSSLACRTMTTLLRRDDCDVNALDAFGNTPVCYALAAGCLSNACFLINQFNCRLEAEYEGQASFYYVLHMAPSFASRTIVRELLLTKRDRAFLHCDAESKTCGCKGYERPREGDSVTSQGCGFCGHESICHRIVPLPSWFRDQYDTYIAAKKSPRKRSNSSEDEDDTETSQQYPNDNEYDTVGDEDEEIVLESGRGRLDVALLRQITGLRYGDVLHANGLTLGVACEHIETTTVSEDELTQEIVTGGSDQTTCSDDNCSPTENEEAESTVNEEMLPVVAGNTDNSVGTSIEPPCNAKCVRKVVDYPIWLQPELAMVHSPRCHCQKSAFVISRRQLAHVAVCRWLRHTAILRMQSQHNGAPSSSGVTESAIIALASVQPAFEHWRGAAQMPARAVPEPPTPLPRLLRSVLFHWQHGKEFVAFQRWKNHQTSAEVAHHRLATRLEHVAAEMRRHRFQTLQLRQLQLQASTRDLMAP